MKQREGRGSGEVLGFAQGSGSALSNRGAGAGVERARGSSERVWRGREGGSGEGEGRGIGRRGIQLEGVMLVMAHHLGVRHKNTHSNGAPFSGVPLVTFFSDSNGAPSSGCAISNFFFLLFLVASNNLFFYQICYFHED